MGQISNAIMQQCNECGVSKPFTIEFFVSDKFIPDGLRRKCKVCSNNYSKLRLRERVAVYGRNKLNENSRRSYWKHVDTERVKNREKQRRLNEVAMTKDPVKRRRTMRNCSLKRKYGITLEIYEKMYEEQKGLCAVCKCVPDGRGLVVDHDHATGKIRGLLCVNCNSMLGMSGDKTEVLRNAIDYLEKNSTTNLIVLNQVVGQ